MIMDLDFVRVIKHGLLKNRPETLKAFLDDFQWALQESQKDELEGNDACFNQAVRPDSMEEDDRNFNCRSQKDELEGNDACFNQEVRPDSMEEDDRNFKRKKKRKISDENVRASHLSDDDCSDTFVGSQKDELEGNDACFNQEVRPDSLEEDDRNFNCRSQKGELEGNDACFNQEVRPDSMEEDDRNFKRKKKRKISDENVRASHLSDDDCSDTFVGSQKDELEENDACFNQEVKPDSMEEDDRNFKRKKKRKMICISSDENVSDSHLSDDDCSDTFPLLNVKKLQKRFKSNIPQNTMELSEDEEQIFDEKAVARDRNNKNIYVTMVKKSMTTNSGKIKKNSRVYNSKHPCPFCPKLVSNFSHHIIASKHKEEPSVKEILEATDPKEKKKKINLLRLKAAHKHNMETLDKKKGELFLRRRANVEDAEDSESEDSGDEGTKCRHTIDIEKYGPCPRCFAWITLKSIKRHMKMCTEADDTCMSSATKGALLVQSNLLCNRIPAEASQSLIKEVYPIMIEDEVCRVAKKDSLIVNLGNQWMLRNKGNEIMRKYYTSSVMRLAAKLKIALQFLDDSKKDLEEYFKPCHFNLVVKSALRCCFPADADEEELKSPSNAIKLGHDIKRMVSAKLAQALMTDDACRKKEAEEFLKLMEIEWMVRVTKLARMILIERAFNKDNTLPLPDDVKKLSTFMQSEIAQLDLNDKTLTNYKKVARFTLSRITLFNRRRCHEVQALKILSYQKRVTGVDELALELRGDLTPFEKNLLNRQEVVVIRGKTGKGVPVILPADTKKALQYLTNVDTRLNVGVPPGNPYVFGTVGAGVFRAHDAIRSVAASAELQNPNLIRTSNMRKYMATMLQALDTNEAERQWVLDHLGHTMDVHKIHYRMTSDVLERVDVAKILLIQDMGLVGRYRGKKLEEIQLDELIEDSMSVPESSTEGETTEGATSSILNQPIEDEEYVPEIFDFDDNEEDDDDYDEIAEKPRRKKSKTPVSRQKWTHEEMDELEKLFKVEFERSKCPSQRSVEKAQRISESNNGLIHKRKRDTIKKKVSNMIVKRRNSKENDVL